MGQVWTENPADVFNPVANPTDWLEIISADSSPSEAHFSLDQQEAVLVGYIPWNKERSAINYFLGYSYVDSNYVLHRNNPELHAKFPWLVATEISLKPFVPVPNFDNMAPLVATNPFAPNMPSPFDSDEITLYIATHKLSLATVRFRSVRYNILDDVQITDPRMEWQRNVYIDLEPHVESLSVDGISQLVFAEDASPNGPVVNPDTGKRPPFSAPLSEKLGITNFTLNWLNVPFDYLSNEDYLFYPANILACMGKVNSDNFPFGADDPFLPGTLLFEGSPRFTQKPIPVASATPGSPLLAVDIALDLRYFSPKKGNTSSTYYGWNLMPWRGRSGDPAGGEYFYATRGGELTDPPLNGSAPFNNIFVSPNA